MSGPRIPTTVIAGALGVGKTSAVLGLAEHQPPGEQWVILVNELGEVGIDGALIDGALIDGAASRLSVEELAGGCLCCTGRGPMRASLRRVLERTRPDRLVIEPSGAADFGRVLDLVRADFGEQLAPRATITLVDPRDLSDPRRRGRPAWQHRVDAADVLVANKLDLCDGPTVQAFLAWAEQLFPPKQLVVTTVGAELDPAWLDLLPGAGPTRPRWVDQTRLLPATLAVPAADHGYVHRGWRFGPERRFSAQRLAALGAALVQPGALVPAGAVRAKGVFHTDRGWQALQADLDGVRWTASGWRGDSRLEVIAEDGPPPDWDSIARLLEAAEVAG